MAKISDCQSGEGNSLHSVNDTTIGRQALLQVLHRWNIGGTRRSHYRIQWLLARQLQVWRLHSSYLLDVCWTDIWCYCHPDECNCHSRRSFIWSIPIQAIQYRSVCQDHFWLDTSESIWIVQYNVHCYQLWLIAIDLSDLQRNVCYEQWMQSRRQGR